MEIVKRNTDYAINALVRLGTESGAVVSASTIAADMELPFSLLQKIMQKLVRAGMVRSHRGVTGGFSLAMSPDDVTIFDVMQVMQGKVAVNLCLMSKDSCPRAATCPVRDSWVGAQTMLVNVLSSVNLRMLIDQAMSRNQD